MNYPPLDRKTFRKFPTEVRSNIIIARDLTTTALVQAQSARQLLSNYRTYRLKKATIIDLSNRARANFLFVYAILIRIQHLHPFLLYWLNGVIKILSFIPTFHPFQ
jgi:hypothetical protein